MKVCTTLAALYLGACAHSTPSAPSNPTAASFGLSIAPATAMSLGCGAPRNDDERLVCDIYLRLSQATSQLVGTWGHPRLVWTKPQPEPHFVYYPCAREIRVDASWVARWRSSLGEDLSHGIAMVLAHELGHHFMLSHHAHLADLYLSCSKPAPVLGTLPAATRILETARVHCEEHQHCARVCEVTCTPMDDSPIQSGACDKQCPKRCHQEWGADFLAGFIGHLAGYNTAGIGERMLDVVYGSLSGPQRGCKLVHEGYPALSERKRAVQRVGESLLALENQFDLASIALSMGESSVATTLFEELAREFPSPEMYNNLGVAWLRTWLDATKPEFVFPLEWLPNERLGQSKGGLDRPLERARVALSTASTLDPENGAIKLNQLILAIVEGNARAAFDWPALAAEVERLETRYSYLPGTMDIVYGILAALASEREVAEQRFIAASASGHPLGEANLSAIRKQPRVTSVAAYPGCPEGQLPTLSTEDVEERWPGLPFITPSLRGVVVEGGAILGFQVQWPEKLVVEVRRRPLADEDLCGIRPGDLLSQVTIALGPPSRAFVNSGGGYLSFLDGRGGAVAVRLSAIGQVLGWAIAGTQKQ